MCILTSNRAHLNQSFAIEVEELQLAVSNLSQELIDLAEVKTKHGQKFMEVSLVFYLVWYIITYFLALKYIISRYMTMEIKSTKCRRLN